jgi:biotin-dependent carboxylase-like uncharacterized protein
VTLRVLEPGVQCTVQAAPRKGLRHAGVPASGPADPVSMALANRLVGKPSGAACLEIAFGPASFRAADAVQVAVTGAIADLQAGGRASPMHATLSIASGETLAIGPAHTGARLYLAVAGHLPAEDFLGSASTYLPARFGGREGRALQKGDVLQISAASPVPQLTTPEALKLPTAAAYALRVVAGPDMPDSADTFASAVFHITPRLSRMGVEIDGDFPALGASSLRPSSAVFTGALQVTPQGRGFLLLPDGQTTGGYPHVLQVIRADRHLLGQLRPGDSVRFLLRTQAQAEEALLAKQALLQAWLPDFRL